MEPRAGVHLLVAGVAMVTQWNVRFYRRDSDRPVFIRVSLLLWTVQTLKVIIGRRSSTKRVTAAPTKTLM